MDKELSPFVQLQGLRLIRAFLRIEDPSRRLSVIELAERFAGEATAGIPSEANSRAADVIIFPDTPAVS